MKSEYAKRQEIRRYAIYCNGNFYGHTSDYDQMVFVKRLLTSDGHKDVKVIVMTANQDPGFGRITSEKRA